MWYQNKNQDLESTIYKIQWGGHLSAGDEARSEGRKKSWKSK